MGWFNSLGPGIAPPDRGIVGEDELDELRRKATQAGQLTSLGAEPGMAQRWSGVPEGPPISTPAQIDSFFDSWEAEGRAAQPGKLFSNPGVEEERRALDLDAEVEAEAARHRPSYQQQLQGIETLDVPGRDIELGMAAPPSGLGQVPAPRASSAPARDLSSMSQAEFQRGIEQAQAGMASPTDRARERVLGDISSLPSIEELQAKFGTREDLGRGLGREELPSGERRWTAPGVSISMRGTPDPAMEAQARAGLADRAFKPQTFDPAEMDVSQATLEHAMAQRAAQAQLSGMESQARQQSAQADAAERDPLGIERYRAQQAIQDARWAAQNAGRRDVSLADDQFRAEQQNTRANRVNEIISSHLESKRALEAALAQAAPDSPEAAMRQQQLDSLREETEMTLAGLGVRLPNTGI